MVDQSIPINRPFAQFIQPEATFYIHDDVRINDSCWPMVTQIYKQNDLNQPSKAQEIMINPIINMVSLFNQNLLSLSMVSH